MTVTHAPKGFPGQVDDIAWAKLMSTLAPPFRVTDSASWLLGVSGATNRTVTINAGSGAATGVYDTTNAQDTVTLPPNSSGVARYDAIVATFDWGTNAVTFGSIQGTTAPPLINVTSSVVLSKINRIPGVRYDALLGIAKVVNGAGLLSSGDVTDLRVWAGFEGYAEVPKNGGYLSLLDMAFGALVHDIATDIVWNKLPGGVWGFEKWVGSNRVNQPMLAVRTLAATIGNNVSTLISWVNNIDHSQGLFTLVDPAHIRANYPGRVRIDALTHSDALVEGNSTIDVALPAGGGNYLASLSDVRPRAAGGVYGGSQVLNQSLEAGPVQVQANDLFSLTVRQINGSSIGVLYDCYLTVTYV